MAQTLLPFPTNMLGGFVKKAALYLPPEHRNPIMVAAQSKAKPNLLLEKTKIIIVCILAAKQHQDVEAFKKDIHDAIGTLELSISEFALFDGFLGAVRHQDGGCADEGAGAGCRDGCSGGGSGCCGGCGGAGAGGGSSGLLDGGLDGVGAGLASTCAPLGLSFCLFHALFCFPNPSAPVIATPGLAVRGPDAGGRQPECLHPSVPLGTGL